MNTKGNKIVIIEITASIGDSLNKLGMDSFVLKINHERGLCFMSVPPEKIETLKMEFGDRMTERF